MEEINTEKIIRIFISSPGDVEMERQRSEMLIERMALEFWPWARLDPYFWEHEPHDSSVDFTTSIGPTSDYDIVIVILRGRLGHRLHSAHRRVDGEVYRSGTEYEVLTALEAQKRPPGGMPRLAVFLNTRPAPLDLSQEKSTRDEIAAQYDALREFFTEHFQAREIAPDGKEILTNKRAYNAYENLEIFEELLEKSLRGALKGLLGIETEHQAVGAAGIRPEKSWDGSPFMKLDVFEAKHLPIYFGRTRAIGQVVEKLRESFGSGSGFLVVFGASGSGKSSLMRAGVLPLVTSPGVIRGVGLWRQAILKPSEGSGDLFLALAAALLSEGALPGLGDLSLPHKEDRMRKLAEELSHGSTAIVARIEGRLNADAELERERQIAQLLLLAREFEHEGRPADAEAARDRAAALPIPTAGFILVVDQMEELYTGPTVEARTAFLNALCALAESRMVLITATLRSDFYSRCEGHSELMRLKEVGNYHLDVPTRVELIQMIREPARAAGLIYEEDPELGRLDERILAAAAADPDSLPLLEMCLDRLYEVRDVEKGVLTHSGYAKIGELEGVLTTYADEAFLTFCAEKAPSQENENLLNEVIKILASPRAGEAGNGGSEAGEGISVVRRVVPYDAFESIPGAPRLVDQFIEKRLFTGGRDTAGKRIVAVTHEALLRKWERVKNMLGLEDNQHFLKIRNRVELRLKQWEESGRDEGFLLQKGKEIEDAEKLDSEFPHAFVKSVKEFIRSSRERIGELEQRSQKIRRVVMAALSVLTLVALIGMAWAVLNQAEVVAQRNEIEQQLKRTRYEEGKSLLKLAIGATESGESLQAAAFSTLALGVLDDENRRAPGGIYETRGHLSEEDRKIQQQFRLDEATELNQSIPPIFLPIWSSPAKMHHEGPVNSINYTAGGSMLVSASGDGSIKLWEAKEGRLIATMSGRPEPILATATDPRGRFLACGSFAGMVTIWKIETQKEMARIVGHEGQVRSLAFSPDGHFLASASFDGYIRLWDTETWTEHRFEAILRDSFRIFSLVYSPDGRFLASGNSKGLVNVWDTSNGKQLASLRGHQELVVSLAFSPDGTQLACGSQDDPESESESLDRPIKIWDTSDKDPNRWNANEAPKSISASWKVNRLAYNLADSRLAAGMEDGSVAILNTQNWREVSHFDGHVTRITSLAFSPDGSQLATGAKEGRVHRWSTSDYTRIGSGDGDFVISTAISPDGTVLATGTTSGTIRLWDATTGEILRDPETGGKIEPIKAHADRVSCLDFSPDGRYLATGSKDTTVKLWNVLDWEMVGSMEEHNGAVNGLEFSPDGSKLISASADGTVKRWEMNSPEEPTESVPLDGGAVISVTMSPDSSFVAIALENGTIVHLDPESGDVVEFPEGHSGAVLCIAVSPDSEMLASGSSDGSMRLWDADTGDQLYVTRKGEPVYSVAFSPNGDRVASGMESGRIEIQTITYPGDSNVEVGASIGSNGHSAEVNDLAFTPDGNRLISGSSDGTARIWNVSRSASLSGEWGTSDSGVGITSIALDPTGKLMVAATTRESLSMLDVNTGMGLGAASLYDAVSCVAFSPDGTLFAVGSDDRCVTVYDAAFGLIKKELIGHSEGILSLAFSSDSKTLATGTGGTELKLWDIRSGEVTASLDSPGEVWGIAFSPDGNVLATATTQGTKLWNLESKKIIASLGSESVHAKSLTYSPDGLYLAIGSDSGELTLWDTADNLCVKTFEVGFQIDSVTVSPDGRMLACGAGKRVRVWDIASGREIAAFDEHTGDVWAVAFTPDSGRLASASSNGELRLWDTKRGPIATPWNVVSASIGTHPFDDATIDTHRLKLKPWFDSGLVTSLSDSISMRPAADSLMLEKSFPLIPTRRDTLGLLADPHLTESERIVLWMRYFAETGQYQPAIFLWDQITARDDLATQFVFDLREAYLKALIIGIYKSVSVGADIGMIETAMDELLSQLNQEDLASPSVSLAAFALFDVMVASSRTISLAFKEGGYFDLLEGLGVNGGPGRLAQGIFANLEGGEHYREELAEMRAKIQYLGTAYPESKHVQLFGHLAQVNSIATDSPEWMNHALQVPMYLGSDPTAMFEIGEKILESDKRLEILGFIEEGDKYFRANGDWILHCIRWAAEVAEFAIAKGFAERLDAYEGWRTLAKLLNGEAALDSWLRVLPYYKSTWEDYETAADMAVNVKNLSEIRHIHESAISDFPKFSGYWNYRYGEAMRAIGEDNEAIKYLTLAINGKEFWEIGSAYISLAILFDKVGREPEFIEAVTQLVSNEVFLEDYLFDFLESFGDEYLHNDFLFSGHKDFLPTLYDIAAKNPGYSENGSIAEDFARSLAVSGQVTSFLDASNRAGLRDALGDESLALEAIAYWQSGERQEAIKIIRGIMAAISHENSMIDWESEQAFLIDELLDSILNKIRAAAVAEDADLHPALNAGQPTSPTPGSALSNEASSPPSPPKPSPNSLTNLAVSQWIAGEQDLAVKTYWLLVESGHAASPPIDWTEPWAFDVLDRPLEYREHLNKIRFAAREKLPEYEVPSKVPFTPSTPQTKEQGFEISPPPRVKTTKPIPSPTRNLNDDSPAIRLSR